MASFDNQTITQLLNLNEQDREAYQDIINDYFGARENESEASDEESSDDTSDQESADECTFTPFTDHILQILPAASDISDCEGHTTTTKPSSSKSLSASPCSCAFYNSTPCYNAFDKESLNDIRIGYQNLTRDELDLVILSKIECGIHMSTATQRPKQKVQSKRLKTRNEYFHLGQRICRDLFMFIHNIGRDKLNALTTHYKLNGVTPRIHKNSKRLPSHALNYEVIQHVINFINNYADIHAITLPGRTPHHWNSDIKLLPTNCTKKIVYTAYSAAAIEDVRKVSERTFRNLWQQLVPFITTTKPATDLCFTCHKNSAKVARSANLPDSEKSAAVKQIEEHLSIVTKERSFYTNVCEEVKRNLPQYFNLSPHECLSFAGTVHYSFDFAQQVCYPSDPLQPGPIYFKAPRKCGIFGVNCEALGRQVNFLIDEACHTGKGADCVISLLHYFFEHYGLGEKHVHLHADNCSGQNKNSAMMWYLLWRVLTGRHQSIRLNFLITGHTKFSPDAGFGLIKKLFRRTRVNCLADIQQVVESSSVVNTAQLCGDQAGNIIVPMFKWTDFLSTLFKKVIAIKSFHHFYFSSDGSITVKQYTDTTESKQQLLKGDAPSQNELPPTITPAGLDNKRKWYLYNQIRQFVEEPYKDLVAPLPAACATAGAAAGESEEETEEPPPVRPSKRARR